MPQYIWKARPDLIVGYLSTFKSQKVIEKIEKHPRLGSLQNKFSISRGAEGSKYSLQEDNTGDIFMVIPENINRYLVTSGIRISSKTLSKTKLESFYRSPKIWCIRIQKMRWSQRIVAGLDVRKNSAGMKTLQLIISNDNLLEELIYLNAIISSRLINFWCINYLADDMNKSYLEKLPIRIVNFTNTTDSNIYDELVSLGNSLMDLSTKAHQIKLPDQKTRIQRQISATDCQIDQLVYELYDLTPEEIQIVEEAVQ